MIQPKLLPWIAHRHGIPLERVRVLWEEGVDLADLRFGENAQTSEYWGYAMRCLDRFAACEGTSIASPQDELALEHAVRSALPLLDSQRRIGGLAFDAAAAFVKAANEYWRRTLLAPVRH
jgi:hypothetical protein